MKSADDNSAIPERMNQMDESARAIAEAPLPTSRTLHARSNPAYQVTRFVAFNIRMLRMVSKAHR
ncbi:MAG: hypothetical protein ACLQUT_03735 [Thermoleophilia bacterium]